MRIPALFTTGDADRNDDVMIEVTEMREEPVVGKQEWVVEEIVVGKNGGGAYRDRTGQSEAEGCGGRKDRHGI
jgi:Domain of unknown function (DUF2382)